MEVKSGEERGQVIIRPFMPLLANQFTQRFWEGTLSCMSTITYLNAADFYFIIV